ATRVHEVPVLEKSIGMEAHAAQEAILSFHLHFNAAQLFISAQAAKYVFQDDCIEVKLTDMVPDVLLRLVAKHAQLRRVGPENHSVCIDPVDTDRGTLQKITQFGLARLQFTLHPLSFGNLGFQAVRLCLQKTEAAQPLIAVV